MQNIQKITVKNAIKDLVYPDKKIIDSQVKFWRDASSGDLDKSKWLALQGIIDKESYIVRYPERQDGDYINQIKFATDPAFSRDILDRYMNFWANIKYEVKISGWSKQQIDAYENNIDGSGMPHYFFDSISVEELLKTGMAIEVVEPIDVGFYVCKSVMREKIRNYSIDGQRFNFFIYTDKNRIAKEFVEYEQTAYVAWDKRQRLTYLVDDDIFLQPIKNEIGFVPVYWQKMGKDARPIINTISKVQFDLLNLQSEWRSIIHDQGGANFLTGPINAKPDVVSNKSYLGRRADEPPFEWVQYPANSLDAHRNYWLTMVELVNRHSKRGNFNAGESGEARSYEFYDTQAVIKTVRRKLENLIKARIESLSAMYDNTGSVEVVFDESSFSTETLDKELEQLIKLNAISFIPEQVKKVIGKELLESRYGAIVEEYEDLFDTDSDEYAGEIDSELENNE